MRQRAGHHVVILQETMPNYRVDLFTEIRRLAADRGITVDILHGRAPGDRGDRLSTGLLPAAVPVRNRYVKASGSNGTLVWQAALRPCLEADLVVVEQANRLLINYLLLVGQRLRGPKVAFLGHGRNFQATTLTPAERFKARVARLPWWWFAYTPRVAEHLIRLGFAADRITVVGNTIDVIGLRTAIEQARAASSPGQAHRCVFLGGLYAEKRLDLLFDAADRIAPQVPGFELHVAGEGELRPQVERFAASRSWAIYHGRVEGAARADLLASARLLLMPGLVGLVVLDSFSAGTPLVTMADSLHSPEIEYLEHGVNGVVVAAPAGPDEYADVVIDLLQDESTWDQLRAGAMSSVGRHTVGEAADHFVEGLQAALHSGGPTIA